ncbi:MAG: sugar phosphate isomerase/epimerase family protein [Candidatus Hydromicrobium sp.]|nr:sugar phosphate isomerase/epimerase family protein [Candidatus Hydromicrobium sp.]
MKYSISNWIYGDEPLEVTFQRLQKYGYDGVELKGEPKLYQTGEVRKLCKKYNLSVLSIAGIYPWPTLERDIASPDEGVRKKAVDYLQNCVDLAAGVGAPLVVVVPSAVGKTSPIDSFEDEEEWIQEKERVWNYAVLSVREAAKYAEAKGILLVIEPINRYETFLVNTAEEGLRFIAEVNSPAVKIHLDVFHMNIEEANPAEAIRRCGKLLMNLHISDSNRMAVGDGHVDFRAIMYALKEIRYQWALTLEPVPPVPNPYVATRLKRYEYLRDKYAEQCITRLKNLEKEIL